MKFGLNGFIIFFYYDTAWDINLKYGMHSPTSSLYVKNNP